MMIEEIDVEVPVRRRDKFLFRNGEKIMETEMIMVELVERWSIIKIKVYLLVFLYKPLFNKII